MAQEKPNPFVLPGFGQQGESAQNPLFAGLEMMRQAWQNVAGTGRLDAAVIPPLSLDELDQRIRELQTVQNWLQLNATMLASTIQGLEIQRSTMSTLKSFAGQGLAAAAEAADAGAAASPVYTQAAEDWWKLIQQQFSGLAAATTASLQEVADAATKPAAESAAPAAKPKPKRAAAAARKPVTPRKTAASTASRTTPRKPRA